MLTFGWTVIIRTDTTTYRVIFVGIPKNQAVMAALQMKAEQLAEVDTYDITVIGSGDIVITNLDELQQQEDW